MKILISGLDSTETTVIVKKFREVIEGKSIVEVRYQFSHLAFA